jgi:hypothetical protein
VSKVSLKERVFNYDSNQVLLENDEITFTETEKRTRRLIASRQLKEGPTSLTNEFNKKILEKGGSGPI